MGDVRNHFTPEVLVRSVYYIYFEASKRKIKSKTASPVAPSESTAQSVRRGELEFFHHKPKLVQQLPPEHKEGQCCDLLSIETNHVLGVENTLVRMLNTYTRVFN